MFNYRRVIGFWLIILPNLVLFYLSLWLTINWRYPDGLSEAQLSAQIINFTIIYFLWLLSFFSFRLFDRDVFRRYTTLFFTLGSAMIANLAIAVTYFYFQPGLILTPRRFLLVHVLLSFILILAWDLILKSFVFTRFIQPVYLFSFNEELKYLETEISKHDYLGFRVQGHISESELKNLPAGAAVIFPDNLHTNPDLAETIYSLRGSEINFYNHNDFYEKLLRRIYIPSLNQIWFLQNVSYNKKFLYNALKSLVDFLSGALLFLVFIILLPLILLLIQLTSPGSVFFKQQRVGREGRVFNIYKFRTMSPSLATNTWTQDKDPRITGFGRLLRLTRLDELPQSINLLKGNMSLVGPRPEQVGIVQELKQKIPFYDERHIVKPGITGWAQLNVYAGNLEESKLKLEYDLYYIKHQSILLDLEIMIKTLVNIFTLQGK